MWSFNSTACQCCYFNFAGKFAEKNDDYSKIGISKSRLRPHIHNDIKSFSRFYSFDNSFLLCFGVLNNPVLHSVVRKRDCVSIPLTHDSNQISEFFGLH